MVSSRASKDGTVVPTWIVWYSSTMSARQKDREKNVSSICPWPWFATKCEQHLRRSEKFPSPVAFTRPVPSLFPPIRFYLMTTAGTRFRSLFFWTAIAGGACGGGTGHIRSASHREIPREQKPGAEARTRSGRWIKRPACAVAPREPREPRNISEDATKPSDVRSRPASRSFPL